MFDNSAVTDSHCQKQDVDSVARRYPGLANAPMGLATAKRSARRLVTLLLLRRLTISRRRFRLPFTGTVIDFSSVSTLLNLQHLDCSGQLLHQYTAHLTSLASLQSLRSLDMSHCRDLSDCSLGMISALSRLTHLNLASCRGVTDTVLSDIASSLYELRHLNVRSCNAISDVGLMHLITLEHLVYLDVSFCSSISDTCVEGLQRHVRAVVRTTLRHPFFFAFTPLWYPLISVDVEVPRFLLTLAEEVNIPSKLQAARSTKVSRPVKQKPVCRPVKQKPPRMHRRNVECRGGKR